MQRVSGERPDLLATGRGRLSRLERAQIAFVRRTFEPGAIDEGVRWAQRTIGARWIDVSTRNLLRVHGLERLPSFDPSRSYLVVANHRSFFDLYVVTSVLVRRGLGHRIVFPVRSRFFYDHPLGLVVNGAMSFFAMYPPIFRERSQAELNLASLDELGWLLSRGGCFAGVHPEGTRKLDDDPYTFLPAQRGVGRVIHAARPVVLPVFVNGLLNDLPRQIRSNFDGTGRAVHVVFGAPLELSDLLEKPRTPRVERAIVDRAMESLAALGAEERRHRTAEP